MYWIKTTLYKIEKRIWGIFERFIWHNNIKGKGVLHGDHNVKMLLSPKSEISIEKLLVLSDQSYFNNGIKTVIMLEDNSKLNVKSTANIYYGADIHLKKNSTFTIGKSFINNRCSIVCYDSISIGDSCAISDSFSIIDSDGHEFNGERKKKPVIIEDHVWIGRRVTVLGGVTIGKGSVIGAGSLVNKDIPPYSLAVGVPARVIKSNVTWKG